MTTVTQTQDREVSIPIATPIRVLAAVQAAGGFSLFIGTLLANLTLNELGQIDLVSPGAVLVALIGGVMLFVFAVAQATYADYLEPEEAEEAES